MDEGRHDAFLKVTVWGNMFYGRGIDFAEAAEKFHKTPQPLEQSRGTWCRLHHYSNVKLEQFSEEMCHKDFTVARLNYFIVVRLPDSLSHEPVNGIPIASVMARKTQIMTSKISDAHTVEYENLWAVNCDNSLSVDSSIQFTALYNIYPTPLAVIRASAFGFPIESCDSTTETQNLLFYALRRSQECIFKRSYLETFHPYHNTDNFFQVKKTAMMNNGTIRTKM